MEYSPFSLDIESPSMNFLATCRELGVAVVAYSPLGRGMLTGRYKSLDDLEEGDFRRNAPQFFADNFSRNLVFVNALKNVADKKQCTAGQLVLAWLLAQGKDIVPIPGTNKIKYLEENRGALDVSLSVEEVAIIRTLIDNAEVFGGRMRDERAFADTPALEV
jgi:aryl-alcohol dehydrogenase-like predicted oxidoreductase